MIPVVRVHLFLEHKWFHGLKLQCEEGQLGVCLNKHPVLKAWAAPALHWLLLGMASGKHHSLSRNSCGWGFVPVGFSCVFPFGVKVGAHLSTERLTVTLLLFFSELQMLHSTWGLGCSSAVEGGGWAAHAASYSTAFVNLNFHLQGRSKCPSNWGAFPYVKIPRKEVVIF